MLVTCFPTITFVLFVAQLYMRFSLLIFCVAFVNVVTIIKDCSAVLNLQLQE